MHVRRALRVLPAAVLFAVSPLQTTAVEAAPTWAPAATALVRPGVMTYTAGGQCTANFVFTDAAGGVYLGQAAHCAGTGAATDTNGCTSASRPLGTPVEIRGARRPGVLAYSSWIAMQAARETDPSACAFNDLGLVKLDPADVKNVNPSVPVWGGPTGLGTATDLLSPVYSYGNSSLRSGTRQLSPKIGVSLGDTGGGWTRSVYTASPGIPGDSGSGFLDSKGKAIGVLSTLTLAPVVASNGVSDLALALAYARMHGGPVVTLAAGTQPFRGTAGVVGILG